MSNLYSDNRNALIVVALLKEHGIRKVIRTWLTSKGVEVNIAELTLQHDVRSKLEKTYNKYSFTEEVRLALQMWGDYVASQLPPEFLSLIKVKEESK